MQQLAKEAQSSPTVTLRLNQNVDDYSVFIYGSPQLPLDAIHLDEDFVQVPLRSDVPSLPSQQRHI